MKILLSGSSGLVGSALSTALRARRHHVIRLLRSPSASAAEAIVWDPAAGTIPSRLLEGLDAVVHLGGDNIASSRWTEQKKELMRSSRVDSTRLLASTLAGLMRPPTVFACASAIGYYGDRGDEILTEQSSAGSGFLPDLVAEWEGATSAAAKAGIRVINFRIGVIMSPAGGALARMLFPFNCCLGGQLGGGNQYMSWVSLEDVVEIITFGLNTDLLSGPVNAVAPTPVTNREFTKALGRALRRPTLLPMPAWLIRLTMGEMGEELLLSSTRVEPEKLRRAQFPFEYETVTAAFEHML